MKICVVSDFDNTITLNNDKTSFASIEKFLNDDFREFRKNMYEMLDRINKDDKSISKEKMNIYQKMWKKKYKYLKESGINQDKIISVLEEVSFKDNFDKYLKYLYEHDIKFIINSAGVGDFIKLKLEQEGLLYPNVKIISNFIYNEKEEYITNVNKNSNQDYLREIKDVDCLILVGDQPFDLSMVPPNYKKKTILIGFKKLEGIDYNKYFDYVIDNEDYYEVLKIVRGLIK